MKQDVTLLMVGTGGYASVYLKELFDDSKDHGLRLVGAVDPYVAKSPCAEEIKKRNIPVYDTLEEFYAEHDAQMAIVSTPIYLHGEQVITWMEHGSDVLCEKPLSASPEDAAAMIEAQKRTGRKLSVGFQWSHSETILSLKKDLLAGKYGKIKRMRTIVYFPRDMAYYRRGGGWAGRRKMPVGEWLLDIVACNATSHYLHNMFFLMGTEISSAAKPDSFTAEVYRINPIEMFDTCAMRLMVNETELLYYATHAVPMNAYRAPELIIEGEKGEIVLRDEGGFKTTGRTFDGECVEYGDPEHNYFRKMYCMRDAILHGDPLPCVAQTALPHLYCIWDLAKLFPETPVIDQKFWAHDEEKDQNHCDCLVDDLERCWRDGKLPWEEGFPWAQQPRTWVNGET